jgi:hypothetical protein
MIHRSLWSRLLLVAGLIVAAGLVGGCALVDKLAGGHVVEPYTPTTPCEIARAESQSACAIGKDQTSAECMQAKAATAKACNEPLPPEPQCSLVLSRSCWHMPPPSEVWLWRGRDGATDYESPAAEPAAPVVPPVTPPAAQCLPDQATWVQSSSTGELAPRVQAALDVYRTEHPGAFEEDGGRLVDHRPEAVDALYDGLGAVLARSGVCAGQIRNAGERGDKLGLLRSDGQVEAFHLVEYGGFRLQAPIRTESVWRAPAATPAPPAGPAATCGEPVPPALGKIKLECKPGREGVTVCDSTPLVYSEGGTFCASIGFFNSDGVTGRLFCSPRQEGDPQRECWERTILGAPGPPAAPVFVWTGPPDQFVIRENPFTVEFSTGKGTVKACNADQKVCSEVKP